MCPRCNAKLEAIEGWQEYGDRIVAIVVVGCMKCGYLLDDDSEEETP